MKRMVPITALIFPLLAHAGEITKVSVLDSELRQVKVISTESELSQFEELWSKKTKQDPVKVKWLYKLDIDTKTNGNRWLYHPTGWVQVLSAKKVTAYKLSSPEEFNKLLGIHNTLRLMSVTQSTAATHMK